MPCVLWSSPIYCNVGFNVGSFVTQFNYLTQLVVTKACNDWGLLSEISITYIEKSYDTWGLLMNMFIQWFVKPVIGLRCLLHLCR